MCGVLRRGGQGLARMASPAWHFNSNAASHKVRLISRAHGPPAPRQTSSRCSVHPSAHSRVRTNTRGNPNAEVFWMCGVLRRGGQGLARMASPAWHFNSNAASHKVRLISRAHGPPAPRQTSSRCSGYVSVPFESTNSTIFVPSL